MLLQVLSSAFLLLSIVAVGSYFHTSLDSLQGTGSEPDGHRTSTLEPPPRQHLSNFPSNSACVCVRNMPRTELCLLWGTWGCHPSLNMQIHPIHVYVGRCWVCKSLCRFNRAAKKPRGGVFGGAQRSGGGVTACAPLRGGCFVELALCSVEC